MLQTLHWIHLLYNYAHTLLAATYCVYYINTHTNPVKCHQDEHKKLEEAWLHRPGNSHTKVPETLAHTYANEHVYIFN